MSVVRNRYSRLVNLNFLIAKLSNRLDMHHGDRLILIDTKKRKKKSGNNFYFLFFFVQTVYPIGVKLLDECGSCAALTNPKSSPVLWPTARCLYDADGKTINSIRELQTDQEVWISFGDPWKNPFSEYRSGSGDLVLGSVEEPLQ